MHRAKPRYDLRSDRAGALIAALEAKRGLSPGTRQRLKAAREKLHRGSISDADITALRRALTETRHVDDSRRALSLSRLGRTGVAGAGLAAWFGVYPETLLWLVDDPTRRGLTVSAVLAVAGLILLCWRHARSGNRRGLDQHQQGDDAAGGETRGGGGA